MPHESDETALCLEGGPHRVVRDVSGMDLAGVRFLSFKAAADAPVRIHVELLGDPADAGRRETEVGISASSRRRPYRLPLDGMRVIRGDGAERITEIAFMVPESYGGVLRLDNIALEDPPRRAPFELAKIVLAGVPAVAGMAAFLVLCLLLRVEEALAVVAWLRDRMRRRRRAPLETDTDE